MSAAVLTARAAGLAGCAVCGRAAPLGTPRCPRCGGGLPPGGRRPLGRVWAWLAAGLLLYIPANFLPMLVTTSFGRDRPSTIVGGAVELAEAGSWGVALVVFTASLVIPIGKFLVIGRLALMAAGGPAMRPRAALRLHGIVEFIGRWSMIDVFVVAILAALIRMGFLASLEPGPAASFFALSVAFTMLAARALDPRLIWDRIGADA